MPVWPDASKLNRSDAMAAAKNLTRRVEALERDVSRLKQQSTGSDTRPGWEKVRGSDRDDPVMEAFWGAWPTISRLTTAQNESQEKAGSETREVRK